jgi:hypothetical protein
MRLLRFFGATVALLGVVALAVVFAPTAFGPRVSAQDRGPFDSAQGRPFDSAQDRPFDSAQDRLGGD